MLHKVNEGINGSNFKEVIEKSLQLQLKENEVNIVLFIDRQSVIEQVFHHYFGYDNKKEFIENKFLKIKNGSTIINIYLQSNDMDNVIVNENRGVVIRVYTKPNEFDKLFKNANYENMYKIYLPWHKKELAEYLNINNNSIEI